MATKLPRLQSKVTQASEILAKKGGSFYKQLLEQNKEHIQDPPTIDKCQLLAKQLFYTRLASIPLRYDASWRELDHAQDFLKKREELNVENAGIAALFGLECFAWLCAGEIVGRGFTFTRPECHHHHKHASTRIQPFFSRDPHVIMEPKDIFLSNLMSGLFLMVPLALSGSIGNMENVNKVTPLSHPPPPGKATESKLLIQKVLSHTVR